MSTQDKADTNDLLDRLIQLDFDTAEAYDAAIERVKDEYIKHQLIDFRADHIRHSEELGAVVRSLGRNPPQVGDARRLLAEGRVLFGGLVGDKGVLLAIKANEAATNSAYEEACDQQYSSAELRELLCGFLSDERRHRVWIEQQLASM